MIQWDYSIVEFHFISNEFKKLMESHVLIVFVCYESLLEYVQKQFVDLVCQFCGGPK